MIINQAALDGIFRNLRAEFQSAYKAAKPTWMQIASRLSSSTAREDHRWFSRWPKMRIWQDERQVRALAAHGYNVLNEKYETTIAVRREDLEDDILGIYQMQAGEAGTAAAEWPDLLVYAALEQGEAALCHDGEPFFDDAHPLDSGDSFSNIVSGAALRADSLANAQASLGAARTKLMKMPDEQGEPMGLMANLLVVPPALEDVARILSMADRLGGDDPNPYKGIGVHVSPRLKSDTKYYVMDVTGSLKPLIFQERSRPEFNSLMSVENVERAFMRDEYLYGVRARGAAAYGLPQCAVLGKP